MVGYGETFLAGNGWGGFLFFPNCETNQEGRGFHVSKGDNVCILSSKRV